MNWLKRRTVLAVILFCLVTCSLPDIEIGLASESEQIANPNFVLHVPNYYDDGNDHDYGILVTTDEYYAEDIWIVRCEHQTEKGLLDQFTYGILPEGCTTSVEPQALEIGKRYEIFVYIDCMDGYAHVFIDERGYLQIVEEGVTND